MPGFKMFGGGRRRNPLVAMPKQGEEALADVTGVVITHEHPDHFDKPALQWIRERDLPVWANAVDAKNLRRKGLDVRLLEDGALGMRVEVVPSRHGRGLLGWLMGPVAGYYLAHPDEPSVYLTGDSILTANVEDALARLQPDVVVAPAGSANMGLGGDILFSVDELVALTRGAPGTVIFNHLEALDHCPTRRDDLRQRMVDEGLAERVHIPDDGAEVVIDAPPNRSHATLQQRPLSPGLQKWVTAPLSGT